MISGYASAEFTPFSGKLFFNSVGCDYSPLSGERPLEVHRRRMHVAWVLGVSETVVVVAQITMQVGDGPVAVAHVRRTVGAVHVVTPSSTCSNVTRIFLIISRRDPDSSPEY